MISFSTLSWRGRLKLGSLSGLLLHQTWWVCGDWCSLSFLFPIPLSLIFSSPSYLPFLLLPTSPPFFFPPHPLLPPHPQLAADVVGCNRYSPSGKVISIDTWDPSSSRTNILDSNQVGRPAFHPIRILHSKSLHEISPQVTSSMFN